MLAGLNPDTSVTKPATRFRIFAGVPEAAAAAELVGLRLQSFQPGDVVLREGEPNRHLFLIESGELEVWRGELGTPGAAKFRTLTAGESIGEISLLNEVPATSSLVARTALTLRALDPRAIADRAVREAVMTNIARSLGARLSETTGDLREEREALVATVRVQGAAAIFAARTLILVAFYTFCLPVFERFKPFLPSIALYSFFVIMVFLGVAWSYLVRSSTGLHDYGFTLKNWRGQILRGLKATVPLLVLVTLLKAIAVWVSPDRFSLFEPWRSFDDHVFHWSEWLLYTGGYVVLTFAQEIVRCAMQGSLAIFYKSARTPDRWRSLLAANVAFAATHVHLGLIFPFLAFVPGFFWGWLYQRDRSYLGVTTSHVVLGTWALFVLGVPY